MGDRATIEIEYEPQYGVVSLYTHWGGACYAHRLAKAIEAAKPRWGDSFYCGRILVDQFFADLRDEETGGGLYPGRCCTEAEHPILTVSIPNKTVTIGKSDYSQPANFGSVYSFEDFIRNVETINAYLQ